MTAPKAHAPSPAMRVLNARVKTLRTQLNAAKEKVRSATIEQCAVIAETQPFFVGRFDKFQNWVRLEIAEKIRRLGDSP